MKALLLLVVIFSIWSHAPAEEEKVAPLPQFKVKPEAVEGVSLHYRDPVSAARMVAAKLKESPVDKAQEAVLRAGNPPGGVIEVEVSGGSAAATSPRHFTATVLDATNKKVARVTGPDVPGEAVPAFLGTGFTGSFEVPIKVVVRMPLRVQVADSLAGKKVVFEIAVLEEAKPDPAAKAKARKEKRDRDALLPQDLRGL